MQSKSRDEEGLYTNAGKLRFLTLIKHLIYYSSQVNTINSLRFNSFKGLVNLLYQNLHNQMCTMAFKSPL